MPTSNRRAGVRKVEESVCRRRVGRDVGLGPKLRLRLLGRGDAAHVTGHALRAWPLWPNTSRGRPRYSA